jgi:hypothetical protein
MIKHIHLRILILSLVLLYSVPSTWANVEAKNLKIDVVRQFGFLIEKVNNRHTYTPELSQIAAKIQENLYFLRDQLNSSIRAQDFDRIEERLLGAISDWENVDLIPASVKLQKARNLLQTFAF